LVPSSGFGYPPDGLLPSDPSGSPSLPQRSWDFPFQAPAPQSAAAFSRRRPHLPFRLHLMTRSELRATAMQSAAPGTTTLRHAPSAHTSVVEVCGRQAACLGFSSLGSTVSRTLNPPSRIILPRAQATPGRSQARHAPRSINQSVPGDCRDHHKGTATITTLLRFLHHPGPQHEDLSTPGYEFTSPVLQHCCCSAPTPWCA